MGSQGSFGRSNCGNQRRGQGRERGRANAGGKHNPTKAAPAKNTQSAPVNARRVAFDCLRAVRENDAYANLVLPKLIRRARLDKRDGALATELVYATCRMQGRYDAIISHCTNRPVEQIDGDVLDVLRLGAHQILDMRIPSHAAVSSAVDLGREVAGGGAAKFINAVLRRVSERSGQQWLQVLAQDAGIDLGTTPLEQISDVDALAVRYSHPRWIVKALRQALIVNGRSESDLISLLEADNQPPAVSACARPGCISPKELIDQASRVGEGAKPGRLSPWAVTLRGGDPGRIEAIRDSRAGVEDEGSQLCAGILAQAPLKGRDTNWLDMCAGPGGKAALLGALAAQRGATLLANEVSHHRTKLVADSVKALPSGVVSLRTGDGRDFGEQESGSYDRILLDAPCSGLGSLRRRPESRWRKQESDVAELASLQRQLLLSALNALRSGGVVAYVTCSPHVLETSLVVKDVLRRFKQASLLDAGEVAAQLSLNPISGCHQQMLQLWPDTDGTDAMFCALIRRD